VALEKMMEEVKRELNIDIAAVGFDSFALDRYSSRKPAFELFEAPDASRLPRTFCYFGDISSTLGFHNEYVGELRAIHELEQENELGELCPIHLRSICCPAMPDGVNGFMCSMIFITALLRRCYGQVEKGLPGELPGEPAFSTRQSPNGRSICHSVSANPA
jgi:hypothetical protein